MRKNNVFLIKFALVFVVLFFLGIVLMVVVHEGIHVGLNNFRMDGFCFFNCRAMASGNYTPWGVYLTRPLVGLAVDENLSERVAGFFGIFIGFLPLAVFSSLACVKYGSVEAKKRKKFYPALKINGL